MFPAETSQRCVTALILKGGTVIDGVTSTTVARNGNVTVITHVDGARYETDVHVSAVAGYEYLSTP